MEGRGARSTEEGKIVHYGWMKKRGEYTKPQFMGGSWKRRYFVLKDFALHYYVDDDRREQKGTINISACTLVRDSESDTKEKFELELVSPKRTYRLRCESSAEFESWRESLAGEIQGICLRPAASAKT